MPKRNTEGYVLAYLLIVIAVMGVIAASLMTSTLQVVQAQEKSLSYMKEKYEAMGEVERFAAELDSIIYQHSNASGEVNFYTKNPDTCRSDAISYLWETLLPNLSLAYPSLEITWDNSSIDNTLNIVCSLPENSTVVLAKLSFISDLTFPSEQRTEKEEYTDEETGDILERDVDVTYYSYHIDLRNIAFESYSISSVGGAA